jgi:hypothetical protein
VTAEQLLETGAVGDPRSGRDLSCPGGTLQVQPLDDIIALNGLLHVFWKAKQAGGGGGGGERILNPDGPVFNSELAELQFCRNFGMGE